jgi:hypothetical protein
MAAPTKPAHAPERGVRVYSVKRMIGVARARKNRYFLALGVNRIHTGRSYWIVFQRFADP